MTLEERRVLSQGCIGITKVRIGQLKVGAVPPMNLAFADPAAHVELQNVEKLLAPGEIVNKEAMWWRGEISQVEDVIKKEGVNWTTVGRDGKRRGAVDYLRYAMANLDNARVQAGKVWVDLAEGDIKELQAGRVAARISGDTLTFERTSIYVEKFRDILAAGPADVKDFMRLVKADPDLAQLRGVDHYLPSSDPSEWKLIRYSKHFWSGQELVRDGRGISYGSVADSNPGPLICQIRIDSSRFPVLVR
ncbi:hypothetical protein ACFYO1_02315 [Nocardia sp. NPDC006044]|uniref:hypothetical protein n=1 Tax=Nocardia sp. NPDC006044 TaxID=3364306 RepID=UPI0036B914AB